MHKGKIFAKIGFEKRFFSGEYIEKISVNGAELKVVLIKTKKDCRIRKFKDFLIQVSVEDVVNTIMKN